LAVTFGIVEQIGDAPYLGVEVGVVEKTARGCTNAGNLPLGRGKGDLRTDGHGAPAGLALTLSMADIAGSHSHHLLITAVIRISFSPGVLLWLRKRLR
jgi:hypothetical protein